MANISAFTVVLLIAFTCTLNATDDITTLLRWKRHQTDDTIEWQGRISGGANESQGSWPWMVHIGNCGGSLIRPDWVITAAHCLDATVWRHPGRIPTNVTMGSIYKNGAGGGKWCGVKRTVMHPRWNKTTFEYDVALVQLDCTVEYTDKIRAIELPESTDTIRDTNDRQVHVAGFGLTRENVRSSESTVLLTTTLNTVSAHECRRKYPKLDNTMMCAYKHNSDSCQGDSGGPLVANSTQHGYVLYGVVSYGIGCAQPNVPGVYHHVPSSVDWVKRVVDGCNFQTGSEHQYRLMNVGKDLVLGMKLWFRSVGNGNEYEMVNVDGDSVVTISNRQQQGDGARVVIAPSTGDARQRFTFVPAPNKTCNIVASHSDKLLDMGSGDGECGESVCQWTSDGSSTQRWRVHELNEGNTRKRRHRRWYAQRFVTW